MLVVKFKGPAPENSSLADSRLCAFLSVWAMGREVADPFASYRTVESLDNLENVAEAYEVDDSRAVIAEFESFEHDLRTVKASYNALADVVESLEEDCEVPASPEVISVIDLAKDNISKLRLEMYSRKIQFNNEVAKLARRIK